MDTSTSSASQTLVPQSSQRLPDIEKMWRLKQALHRENWDDMASVREKARTGIYQIHDRPNCVCVTHLIRRADGSTACNIVALAGEMSGVSDMVNVVEAFARAEGCAIITWSGRPGWARVFHKMSTGYRQKAVIYEKVLTDAQQPERDKHDPDVSGAAPGLGE